SGTAACQHRSFVEVPRQPKVGDLGNEIRNLKSENRNGTLSFSIGLRTSDLRFQTLDFSFGLQEYVSWLKIAVDNPAQVRHVHSLSKHGEQFGRLAGRLRHA